MSSLVRLPLEIIETLPQNLILLGYRGSQAHGTYTAKMDPDSIDDIDLMGIYVGEPEHYLGFGRRETVEQWVGEYDCVYYELRKMFQMLMKSNPNVLSMLFLEDRHTLYRNEFGDMLLENRDLFLSKSAYYSFSGYAHSQMKKMEHIAEKDPEVLQEYDEIHHELNIREQIKKGYEIPDLDRKYYYVKSQALRERSNQIQKHEGYMGRKRRELVDHYGYDTKNASHLIRILRMCSEFLDTSYITVERKDAQDFIDIKQGKWTLGAVKAEAEFLQKENERKHQVSPLPESPDKNKVERLCVDMVTKYHKQ